MKKERLVIFDMDGTLIDSSEAMTQSVNYVRNAIGLETPVSKEALEYHINALDQQLPKIFYNTETYHPEHRALFKEHYMQYAPSNISLYPDVRQMLEVLSQKAHLGIATNAHDCFAHNMLDALDIAHYFSGGIVGANNVAEPKPSPLMVEELMKTFGAKAEETVLVGDSIKDEQAAFNAGVSFIFANWGYGKSQTSNLRAHNVHELLLLLNTLI
ncbi:HAD family hydrolase [Sulfurospirillum barnesii]|uniref:phosphoglycolate phosphatase n=1 Tax=Sulfurospirillum barnesii (strain ATCC 700032 / DSM 10660 / SES-3) TaxID=760154 RepID=I3XWY2_SULBS|nr:HAD family hydrolase [Sulfurospirillum barnesii]AFL68456.1 haloacid dehalogenase superfamily enzyme, subfamily IA [Sulfurospirillum barnesii SES-3]